LWTPDKRWWELRDVPDGDGGIIGWMTVSGTKGPLCDDYYKLDYGDIGDWEIIPCDGGCPLPPLSRGDLMEALGKPRDIPPRFLSLYKVPDECGPALRKLGLPAC
jgi:hypothetical protein